MSTKPNPVALTAAMLLFRRLSLLAPGYETHPANAGEAHKAADLASQLHRLQPAFKRHAEALCNGEWREGQRDDAAGVDRRSFGKDCIESLDKSIADYGTRLERKLAKLNALLAPLAVQAHGDGDPRGCVLYLTSTNATPIPHHDMSGDRWAI